MLTTLQKDGLTEGWQDVEKMVYDYIHKHLSNHEGNFDDCLEACQIKFFYCWESYEPEQGLFSSWLRKHLYYALMQIHRDNKRNSKQELKHVAHLEGVTRSTFDLRRFASELSRDAKQILQIVCDCPSDVSRVIELNGVASSATKVLLKDYLEGYGWSSLRVNSSFSEIQQALS